MYDNPWLLNNKPFTSEMIGNYIGFVYEITDLSNNKKYIGKKNFYSTRKLPPLKGKVKKRKKGADVNVVNRDGRNSFALCELSGS